MQMIAEIDKDRPELPAKTITDQVEIANQLRGLYRAPARSRSSSLKSWSTSAYLISIDYDKVTGISIEARQKLKQFRPVSVGQASRLSGVTPADISVLLIYMKNYNSGSRKPEDKEDKENSN
jgi:tRNA uridine 5-carboxymethylaminomethyl modification enzyme